MVNMMSHLLGHEGLISAAAPLMAFLSLGILPTAGFVPSAPPSTVPHHVQQQQHAQYQGLGFLHTPSCRIGKSSGVSLLQMSDTGRNEGESLSGENDDAERGIYGYDKDIIDREAAEAPLRKLRLILYGLFGFSALSLGAISIAGIAGVEQVQELAQNLPNPLIDLGVVALSFYFWVEEVKTKRSALRLMEKRREEELRVPNRFTRRAAKQSKKARLASQKTATVSPEAVTMNNSDTPPSETASKTKVESTGEESDPATSATTERKGGGIFDGIRKTLDDVNQQSYFQALALNKELEDKGVLPKLDSVPGPPPAGASAPVEEGGMSASRDAGGGSGAGDIVRTEGTEAVLEVVPEEGAGEETQLVSGPSGDSDGSLSTRSGGGEGGRKQRNRAGAKKGKRRKK